MNQTNFVLFLLILCVSACIPVRKEIFLKTEDHPKDPVLDVVTATYQPQNYEYQLSTNDVISIKVASVTPSEFDIINTQTDRNLTGFSNRDPLLSGFRVEEDGSVFLPIIGKVQVAGLNIPEAREKIEEIVSDYLESPTVDIKLLSFTFTMLGEVQDEGLYTTYNPKFSILDAVGSAGGLSDFGDGSRVKLVRYEGEILQVAYVDLMDEDLLSSPYFYLRPNDVVTVPPLRAKNWRNSTSSNVALILSAFTAVGIFLNVFN